MFDEEPEEPPKKKCALGPDKLVDGCEHERDIAKKSYSGHLQKKDMNRLQMLSNKLFTELPSPRKNVVYYVGEAEDTET